METSKIYNEDSLDTMKRMEDNVIDQICTDPPYGYSFMGKDWDKVVMGVEYWQECLRVLKPGGFCFVMASPRQDVLSRQIIRLQDAGFDVGFTSIYWAYASGFPKAGNIGKLVDKRLGVDGNIVGYSQEGFKSITSERVNQGYRKNLTVANERDKIPITTPSSNEAKELDGSYSGFQPKPAVEVVIVAMKPLSEKTFIDQALKNKKGITWLDDCRVPYESDGDKDNANDQSQGRFPANLLVSDDVLNDGRITIAKGKDIQAKARNDIFDTNIKPRVIPRPNDSGSFSRYFDLDKWWEERIKELPKKVQKSYPFLIVPKAAKSEKNDGTDNNHPTVKPVKLMSYLITLGSRPDDIIYDPFCGSGTTLISAEITRRKWIGSEISEEYHKIAKERIKRELHQLKLF